jgi:hypothetical protein
MPDYWYVAQSIRCIAAHSHLGVGGRMQPECAQVDELRRRRLDQQVRGREAAAQEHGARLVGAHSIRACYQMNLKSAFALLSAWTRATWQNRQRLRLRRGGTTRRISSRQ